MRSESFPEFEELNWAVVHGRGVLHTGHANTFARVLATATLYPLLDFMNKVRKALEAEGPSLVRVLTPCPKG
jgi:pyruvate/2-oxoacid:ferredoxin oxidoreductase beta subunit